MSEFKIDSHRADHPMTMFNLDIGNIAQLMFARMHGDALTDFRLSDVGGLHAWSKEDIWWPATPH